MITGNPIGITVSTPYATPATDANCAIIEQLTTDSWTVALRHLLVEGKKAVASAQAEGKTALPAEQVTRLLARYDQQITIGFAVYPIRPPIVGHKGRVQQAIATKSVCRLRDFKTPLWRFLTDWRVPFDNNPAERLVRP
jgi:transposase